MVDPPDPASAATDPPDPAPAASGEVPFEVHHIFYRRYCKQMRALAGWFEALAGERTAAVTAYTALTSRIISWHFRILRDGGWRSLKDVLLWMHFWISSTISWHFRILRDDGWRSLKDVLLWMHFWISSTISLQL